MPAAQVYLNLAGARQYGCLNVWIFLVDRRNSGIALRLAHHGHFEHASCDELRWHLRAQTIDALLFEECLEFVWWPRQEDRKSTRLNSSHVKISYAVFCLKKKK